MRTSFRPKGQIRLRQNLRSVRPLNFVTSAQQQAAGRLAQRGVSLFTSESVTGGHPDKVCDQISDAVLDAIIAQDPQARVACETLVKNNAVVVAGEVTTTARYDVGSIVREAITRIGYDRPELGFDAKTCTLINWLDRQSPEIAMGVDAAQNVHKEMGAGDQGMMFGFACRETEELMPMPLAFAHQLTRELTLAREKKRLGWLRPDGKSQVTIEYLDGRPQRIHTVVISTQHDDGVSNESIREGVMSKIIHKVLPLNLLDGNTIYHINPTGRFVIGGPVGDSGVTGRKIIVDTYGGMGTHGGGAFSGKDPSKVDRSAAYAARWIAKHIVAAGLSDRCEVQLAYAIGYPEPVSVMVNAGNPNVSDQHIAAAVRQVFGLTPQKIIDALDLLKPRYSATASGGHFGRRGDAFTWENTDRVDLLKAAVARA